MREFGLSWSRATGEELMEERMMNEDGATAFYQVVVNDEEQYSIWPTKKSLPAGWRPCGRAGTKDECLDYIETVWTDMRPRSLRVRMESQESQEADTSQ